MSSQTVREAEKFGIEAKQSRDGKVWPNITVTNYEKLHLFNPNDFAGVVGDESGGIKHFDAKRTAEVIEFMRTMRYRLLCTATAAPNDYVELGTSSEALGELGFQDMITKFFRKEKSKDHLGWGRKKYELKGHADHEFWRWVCSWARAIRKPSDLGFDDGKFLLPELTMTEHVIQASTKRPGYLIDMPAITLEEQREERRRTIPERCEKVAQLVANQVGHSLVWCHLNDEGDLLEKLIPNSVQISGKDSDEEKEEKIQWFIGDRCLCGKKSIGIVDEKSIEPILLSEQSVKDKAGRQTKTKNTCESTISLTNQNSDSLENNGTPATISEEKDIEQTQNTKKPKKPKSKLADREIRKLDSPKFLGGTACPLTTTTECRPIKKDDVQFAEQQNLETEDSIDLSSIIATHPAMLGDSYVPDAISASEDLEITRICLREQRCTCGRTSGKRVLISKPVLLGWGLNFQHCAHQTLFPSHSFEMAYQAVRRCWRFGQKNPVHVDMVASEGERGVLENQERKSRAADFMFAKIVELMHDHLNIRRSNPFTDQAKVPSWLSDGTSSAVPATPNGTVRKKRMRADVAVSE